MSSTASAALAVQTLIMTTLLPADPRLRHQKRPARGGRAAARQTPGGASEVRAHLRRLVRHIRTRWHKTRIYVPWRRALCRRSNGRGARTTASTISSSVRYQASRQKSRRDRRRHPHATRHRDLPVCAAIPRRATRHSPGIANGAPSPVLRRRRSALDIVSSSQPRCRLGRVDLRQSDCARGKPRI